MKIEVKEEADVINIIVFDHIDTETILDFKEVAGPTYGHTRVGGWRLTPTATAGLISILRIMP